MNPETGQLVNAPASSDEAQKLIHLPNYSPGCSKCYGRGHVGRNVADGLYVPCPRCIAIKRFGMRLSPKTGRLTGSLSGV